MKKTLGRYIGVIAFILVLLIPTDPSVFPTDAKYVASVTLLMVIWWVTEAIPIQATALLPVILFPALGVLTPAEACAPYADKTIFLFMGGFIIAMSMQRWGLHERIALNIINRVGTSPRMLILGFMVATAFLSMWISNTATAMMMVPIAIAIIATILPKSDTGLGEMTEQQRDFSECIVISIAYAATIGGIATIIGTPPNGIFVAQMETIFPSAPAIDFFTWMEFALPLACVMLPLAWLWLTYGPYRHMPGKISSGKEIIAERLRSLGEMGRGEKWTLLVFAMTAAAWIMRSEKHIGNVVIPGITTYLPFVGDSTIAIAGAVLLFLLPVDTKEGVFTMNWEWAKKIPWGILILFGGGICLSTAFIKSGLAGVIMQHMTFMHVLPVVVAVLVVALLVSLLTEVTSNTAIASVMMPVMAVTAVSMGIHPYLLMLTAAFACSMAFMLPVATPPNAVAYSSGYVEMKDMIRTGWILNIVGIFILTLFMFTIISWILGFSTAMPDWAFEPAVSV
ncbi:sodium-dependent dicarboxylate transporter 2/3/5 [Methanomicrobium sp. W14]|uniref:SLC13 family permease n=1 Tax=Methanomicrobium sp. W14 TaxID=2817839 RepID=UPI001AE9549F|nr:SLC13 family permease [Methanomicrobium sp. W14]MBP2133341.1 sodium-dependent dicarboxylate transporter 2/3/5 [Methanomicrobium sp. W14]